MLPRISEFEDGKLVYGEPSLKYRENEAISNSDLSLVKISPDLIEWNKEIHASEELTSSSILEGSLFHKLFLETDFYPSITKIEPSKDKGLCITDHTLKVFSDNCMALENKRVITTISGLRATLKGDGFPIKTTAELSECLKIIEENNLPYLFLDEELKKAQEEGYDFLNGEQIKKYFLMCQSLLAHKEFMKLYETYWESEVSLYLNPSEITFGIPLKGRVDMLTGFGDVHYIVDIKTISNLDDVEKNIRTYGYFRQAAFYKFLLGNILKIDASKIEFLFAFVETNPKLGKYRSLVVRVGEESLNFGISVMSDLLETYALYNSRDKNTLTFQTI